MDCSGCYVCTWFFSIHTTHLIDLLQAQLKENKMTDKFEPKCVIYNPINDAIMKYNSQR
jgi:hypothetical protein